MAVVAGRILGAGLIVLGVLEALVVSGGVVPGLWLALIGWFLAQAAALEGSRRPVPPDASLG